MNGSLQLFEYPGNTVRLSCEKCGRSGQYRKQNWALRSRYTVAGFAGGTSTMRAPRNSPLHWFVTSS